MQCGFFRQHFVCLQNSTRQGEFFEGRVCWDPAGTEVVWCWGEPCHVGDTMAFCTAVYGVSEPERGWPGAIGVR